MIWCVVFLLGSRFNHRLTETFTLTAVKLLHPPSPFTPVWFSRWGGGHNPAWDVLLIHSRLYFHTQKEKKKINAKCQQQFLLLLLQDEMLGTVLPLHRRCIRNAGTKHEAFVQEMVGPEPQFRFKSQEPWKQPSVTEFIWLDYTWLDTETMNKFVFFCVYCLQMTAGFS